MTLLNPATTKRDDLVDSTSFCNCFSSSILLKLVWHLRPRWSLRLALLDPSRLHNRNHLSHLRQLVYHHSILIQVVRETTIFVQFEKVHEPTSGSNITNVDVLFRRF